MERRLSAILAPDVAGYSRLMGEDVKASRDTGQGVHKSRTLHGLGTVSGSVLDKIAACHRADSVSQCWN